MQFTVDLAEGIMLSGLDKLLKEENMMEIIAKMAKHWSMVKETNQKFNLTAITDDKEAVEKHYIDSLVVNQWIKKGDRILDIGSGAGFPGIPLAISRPDCQVFLLDSMEKKCNFLKEVKDELSLTNVEVICDRAEKLGQNPDFRASFDVVVCRAVAAFPVLLEYGLPLVKKGGFFVAMKGPGLFNELDDAKNALKLLGGKVDGTAILPLPFTGSKRCISVVKKIEDTPEKYPRREGKPEKSPL